MRMDAVFPPVMQRSDSDLPVGHLLPLGYQREPEGPVKEYTQPLAPTEFWEQHARDPYVPLVYRQAIAKAPAVTNWQSDEYIREKYGDLDVLVEKKHEDRLARPKRMPLSEFLDNYQDEDWYVVSLLPDPMRAEMQVPRSLLCGTFKKNILESNLWLSAGGTKSLLHYDADHNLHCLISGRKDFIMIDSKYDDLLDMADKKQFSGSSFSHLDMDSIDLLTNPHVSEVPWTWATLQPGDCIFIPAGYFHQVRSYGRSVAATIMWSPLNYFDDTDCATTDIAKYAALSDVTVQWTYKKGDKFIDMGYMNVEMMRDALLNVTKFKNSTKLTKEMFTYYYESAVVDEDEDKEVEEEDLKMIDRMFGILDKDETGYITRQGLESLDIEVLKDIARLMDESHGPVTENDEDKTHDEL
ncbi:bifunctional peptidase and arginyl-hydroxylase JMJD5-like [Branchiostoma lanceolatum]|uniref:bifunctional peptidase and arginyl-hydroxylase JMJD5-like n=1 Tax=Branchiostoma lanceolatum TaxID=7740 RepID=UPI0034526982